MVFAVVLESYGEFCHSVLYCARWKTVVLQASMEVDRGGTVRERKRTPDIPHPPRSLRTPASFRLYGATLDQAR